MINFSSCPFPWQASGIHHCLALVIRTAMKQVWMVWEILWWWFTLHQFWKGRLDTDR